MRISFVTPTGKSAGRAFLVRVAFATRTLADRVASRIAMKRSLGRLSDRHLRDIGLTRDDVDAALYEPLSEDASEKLAAIVRTQPRNW